MIGTFARSFRHFKRSVGNTKPSKILFFGNRLEIASAINMKCRLTEKEELIIFQNRGGDRDIHRKLYDENGIANDIMREFNYFYIINNEHQMNSFGRRILILPNDIETQYETFVNNNKKLLTPIISKYGFNKYDANALFTFCMCNESPNLFAWGLGNLYKGNLNTHTLFSIFKWYEVYGGLSNKLLNGTITAYNSKQKIDSLVRELHMIRQEKRANSVINSFNTAQKKLLKNAELDDTTMNILSKFGKLSQTKQINFIRKMSTIEDIDEIIRQMKLLVKVQYEWNKESFMNFLTNSEDFKFNLIYDKDNIVIVQVDDFETIKHIAKTTNWCISKNLTYWNNYMHDKRNKQYVMYDFARHEDDEYSIVGFTIFNNFKITHSHSFTNIQLMSSGNNNKYRNFKCIISTEDIYSLLYTNKVPIDLLLNAKNSNYEWNRDSFLKFLDYAVTRDSYDIIKDEDNKIVLFVKHSNVRFLIGSQYSNTHDEIMSGGNKHILFLDFNLSDNNKDRLRYGIIFKDNEKKSQEYCDEIFNACSEYVNETIDDMLNIFGLPYDTICRVYDKYEVYTRKFFSCDIESMKEVLSNKEIVKKVFSDENNQEKLSRMITFTMSNYRTYDIIDMILEHGYKLSDLIGGYKTGNSINHSLYEMGNYNMRFVEPITDDLYNRLINHKINSDYVNLYFSLFYALKIIHSESDNEIFEYVAECFNDYSHYNSLIIKPISELLIDKMSFIELDQVRSLLHYICNANDDTLFEKLLNKDMSEDCITYVKNNLSSMNHFYNRFQNKKSFVKVIVEDKTSKVFETTETYS